MNKMVGSSYIPPVRRMEERKREMRDFLPYCTNLLAGWQCKVIVSW